MVAEAPGPINFTMFLGLFGDRLKGNWSQLVTINVQLFKPPFTLSFLVALFVCLLAKLVKSYGRILMIFEDKK